VRFSDRPSTTAGAAQELLIDPRPLRPVGWRPCQPSRAAAALGGAKGQWLRAGRCDRRVAGALSCLERAPCGHSDLQNGRCRLRQDRGRSAPRSAPPGSCLGLDRRCWAKRECRCFRSFGHQLHRPRPFQLRRPCPLTHYPVLGGGDGGHMQRRQAQVSKPGSFFTCQRFRFRPRRRSGPQGPVDAAVGPCFRGNRRLQAGRTGKIVLVTSWARSRWATKQARHRFSITTRHRRPRPHHQAMLAAQVTVAACLAVTRPARRCRRNPIDRDGFPRGAFQLPHIASSPPPGATQDPAAGCAPSPPHRSHTFAQRAKGLALQPARNSRSALSVMRGRAATADQLRREPVQAQPGWRLAPKQENMRCSRWKSGPVRGTARRGGHRFPQQSGGDRHRRRDGPGVASRAGQLARRLECSRSRFQGGGGHNAEGDQAWPASAAGAALRRWARKRAASRSHVVRRGEPSQQGVVAKRPVAWRARPPRSPEPCCGRSAQQDGGGIHTDLPPSASATDEQR